MKCPKCQSKTKVIDSRPRALQTIYRRRLCKHCGLKFNTRETITVIEDCQKIQKEVNRAKEQIQRIAAGLEKISIVSPPQSEG